MNEHGMSGVHFGTLQRDGSVTNARTIRQSDIARCPHVILVASHYREDGSCRCDDPDAPMREAGYRWNLEARRWE